MRNDGFLDLSVAVLALCAIVTTSLVVRREFFSSVPRSGGPVSVPNWMDYVREGHRMGPSNAPVTIVVFSDFQCPYCAILMSRLREIRSNNPRTVAVIYRHAPIPNHLHATKAAEAAECASAQGRFEPFHDALFSKQDSIGILSWERFAAIAEVPSPSMFRRCLASSDTISAITRDISAASALGVDVTPTFLINGTRLEGAQPLDTLQAYVARAMSIANR